MQNEFSDWNHMNNATEKQLIAQIKIGGIYKHYKNKLYKVHMVSKSADDLTWWVVYEALYENELSTMWHRKLEDFLEVGSWIDGQPAIQRFTLIENNESKKI